MFAVRAANTRVQAAHAPRRGVSMLCQSQPARGWEHMGNMCLFFSKKGFCKQNNEGEQAFGLLMMNKNRNPPPDMGVLWVQSLHY